VAAEVRGAGAGELSAVREIISQAWSNPEDEPALWDYLAANHPGMRPECVRVAEADGQLVACAVVLPCRFRTPRGLVPGAEITLIACRPDHERRGYGSAVFRDALAYMAGRGPALAVLGGDPGFYGRFGCAPILPICRSTLEVNAASPPAAVESPVPYSAGSDADLRPVTQNDLRGVAALYRWGSTPVRPRRPAACSGACSARRGGAVSAISGSLFRRTIPWPAWPWAGAPSRPTAQPPRGWPLSRSGTQLVVGYRGIDDLLLAGHAELAAEAGLAQLRADFPTGHPRYFEAPYFFWL